MPLTTRYGFARTPHPGNPSLAWTLLSSSTIAGATTVVLDDVSAFPIATEFDITIGERQVDGTVSNLDEAHVLSISGNTLTLSAGLTFAHAAMESVYHVLTETGLKNNPLGMTSSGDFPFLNSSARQDRMAAPTDGDAGYAVRWVGATPSWTTSPSFAGAVTAPDFHWSGAKNANKVLAGPVSGGDAVPDFRLLVTADIPTTLTGKTLVTPTVASFINASHDHLNAAGGGTITAAAISDLASATVAFTNKSGAISQWTNDSGYVTSSSAAAFTNKTGAISQWTNDAGYVTSAGVGGSIADTQVAFGSGTSIAGSANLLWVPPIFTVGGSTTARIDWKTTGHTVDMKLTNLTNFFSVTGAGSYSFDATVNATAFAYPDISGDTQVQFNNAGAISGSSSFTWDGNLHVNGSIIATASSVTAFTNKSGAISQWTNDSGYATASSATAFTNKSGNISQWTNDSGYLTSVTGHNLLSSTHSDTLTGSVVRGDLIYGNSTPKWSRLAAPGVLSGLSHDGTDVSWVTVTGTGAPVRATSAVLVTPTLGVASATSLATSAASPLLLTNGKLVTVALTTQTVNPATLTLPDFASVSDTFVFITLAQTLVNKTLTTPTISSFVNANHSHLNAAGGGTITAAAISDLSSATVAFTNKSGNISQWTNDSGYVAAHNLLSATHSDTTVAAAVRGDLITGQAASPLWKRLAIGSANSFLKSDGTDVSWSAGLLSIASGKTVTFDHTSTFTTTDAQTYTFPPTSATLARTDAANTFTGHQTIEGVTSTGATGTGKFVFDASPTISGTLFVTALSDPATLANIGFYISTAGNFYLGSTQVMGWSNGSNLFTRDLLIARDAANTLAQRNSTTAQTSRIYETYTDGSNYSRLSISAPSGGPITFASEAAGTGTARGFQFTTTGYITVSATTSGYVGGPYMFQANDNNAFRADASGVGIILNSVSLGSATVLGWAQSTAWYDTQDLILRRAAAAILQLGSNVNAAATAQIIQAANAITGSNLAGGNLTLRPGAGMGTGTVSALIIQSPTIAASGANTQAQAERARFDSSGMTIADAHNLVFSGTTGTKFGTATSQKMAWWNATPVIQQSRVGQLTDSTTGTPSTILVDVGVVFSQASINNNFSSVLTKLNAIDSLLHTLGLSA